MKKVMAVLDRRNTGVVIRPRRVTEKVNTLTTTTGPAKDEVKSVIVIQLPVSPPVRGRSKLKSKP